MMYGVVKGVNGQILGQHAIDPTAPGGMQAQVNKIAAERGMAQPLPSPPAAQGPHAGPNVPMPGVMPAQVFLRFSLRMADGSVRQVTHPIHVPLGTGVPPGVYQLVGSR